jgi:hypothetical protein
MQINAFLHIIAKKQFYLFLVDECLRIKNPKRQVFGVFVIY